MADTIADITVTHTEYADVNTLLGLGVGLSISIQNKEDTGNLTAELDSSFTMESR